MSGGAWERVAAYVNNNHGNLQNNGKSIVNGVAKYKEVYTQGTTDTQELNYKAAATKYGDAIYETSNGYASTNASWYSDYTSFSKTNGAFFNRGGSCSNNISAGMFAFQNTTGDANSYDGFRVVIPVF